MARVAVVWTVVAEGAPSRGWKTTPVGVDTAGTPDLERLVSRIIGDVAAVTAAVTETGSGQQPTTGLMEKPS